MHDYHQLSDAALVARARASDHEAFGQLLTRHYASVVRLCRRLLGAAPEAQDIAQEAALQAFLGLDTLDAPERFGAWLHAIAANLARMELRRRRTTSLEALPPGATMLVLWAAAPHTPEEIHAAREIHDTIVAALSELSALNRAVVIGFYLDGYSYAELAELLGVPVSTIKGRLFKGRRQLRRRLGANSPEELLPARAPKERAMSTPELVEVEIESIRKGLISPANVVMLRAKNGTAVLPIWIGAFEGESIAMILQQRPPHRPITHDLSLQMVAALGGQVRRVTINRLVEKTFYAEIDLALGDQQHVIDARPSDAIALAVRVGAPIYAAQAVLDAAGAPSDAEWMQLHAPDIAGQGPLARLGATEQTWSVLLAAGAGTPEQRSIPLAEFTSSDWPALRYQRDIAWEGENMLAIQLPAVGERSPWLIVPPDFWERQALAIIRPNAPPKDEPGSEVRP
jgi:RNA polymerase sigma factor (sigma-70 family)